MSKDCLKFVAGIEPLVEDFLIFRFKICFGTSSIVVVSKSKSKSLMSISGKNYMIFLILTYIIKFRNDAI